MALTNYKLGDLISKIERKNTDLKYSVSDVRGVSAMKHLIPTKADLSSRNISVFSVLHPGEFVFNRRTTRMGDRICVAFNDTGSTYILTEDYVLFRVIENGILLPEYLFLFFNRSEFDRYARYNSWGSATELFSWDSMCEVPITLPDIKTQQKFVNVYKAMVANQQAYEKGLDDLKLTCDAYIEDLRRKMPSEKIGSYICQSDRRNDLGLTQDDVRGISIEKKFIFTKADMTGVNVANYKIVEPGDSPYSQVFSSVNSILFESS